MMKGLKRLASAMLALTVAASLAIPAFADEDSYTITINNDAPNHTYEAYQIFEGDLHERVLSNIMWGNGISDEGKAKLLEEYGVTNAAGVANKLTDENVADFADLVEPYLVEGACVASEELTGPYTISISKSEAGYYLVKDHDGSLVNKDDAYTSFMLKVVGDVAATPKSGKPTFDLLVWDEPADAEEGHESGWGETADHAINETYQYKMTATIPADEDLADYDSYELVFEDTLAAGVTFEGIEKVSVNGQEIEEGYSSTTVDEGSWTLTVDDVTDHAAIEEGAVVEVLYSAHLNEGSSLGAENANANTARLKYSNNPNPNAGDSHGVTASDTVWVFTYAMNNTKVDDKGNALAGAKFKLYADEECTQEVGLVFDDAMSAYSPVKSGESAETLVSADGSGKFDIKGLDTGTYYLSEIEAPAGYNTCADVAVGIAAEHAEGSSAATASTVMILTVDGESATAVEVVNHKGSTLPSTGGMGTTLLYVAGGVLVIGAMALLIMRRRAKDCE